MKEPRTATRVRLWALLFVIGLIITWFLFLRLFAEEGPGGGPATAEPSAARSATPIGDGGPATWTHDAAAEIGPDTTAFTAWVAETECASGQSNADRIIGQDVHVSSDSIVVTFRVRSLSGF